MVLGTELAYRVDAGELVSGEPASPDPVSRLCVGRLDATFTRTPTGGLRIPASLTRTGVLSYRNTDGSTRREYRPADEVFKADSLATLEDAPVTDLHPSSMVDGKNFGTLSKGHAREARQDGKFVAATVLVQDADLVAKVERRDRKEISCGYRCRLDMTPGTSPDGEAYDAVQRDIVYNHVALLPVGTGRAGREVALRLDAAYEDSTDPSKPEPIKTMKTIRIDGKDYVIGSDEHLAKLSEDSKKAADALAADRDAHKARADKAEAAVVALTARVDAIEKPAKEAARKDLEAKAAKVLGAEFKFDGVSDEDIRKAVADKALEAPVTKPDTNGGARAAAVLSTLPAVGGAQLPTAPTMNLWEQNLSQHAGAR